ncbi:MAG: hypothetical protein KF869_15580 [Phycisphaeraceae bacterium]|nr:hypothetical protein [Phycisphaeraceae bacterium]
MPLKVPAVLAVAEKPGPLLEADLLPEPLDEPEDEKDDDPLDLPDEPEPLLEPDPEPDADAEIPLPDPEEAAVAGMSLWTHTPSAEKVFVPGMWIATVRLGASMRTTDSTSCSFLCSSIRTSPGWMNSAEAKPHRHSRPRPPHHTLFPIASITAVGAMWSR